MKSFSTMKQIAVDWIEGHSDHLKRMSNTVWLYAEPPLQEFRSSALLANELEASGFRVDRGVAGLETAFVATYGRGRPVLATYAEYDATEGISQMPVPYPRPVIPYAGGFLDMHNGLGAGALGAALAVREVMERKRLPGTLKVFGTPAEKLLIGKPYMARTGLFRGLDAVIGWHPGDKTDAEPGWGYRFRACQDERFTFKGASVYSGRPWAGTSALDAVMIMDVAVQYMREHLLPPEAYFIVNSIVTDGGQTPTNIPGRAELLYRSRVISSEFFNRIRDGLQRCAQGAAIATGTDVESELEIAVRENLPNIVLAKAMHANIERIGAPKLTKADKEFARKIQKKLGWKPADEPFDLMTKAPSGAMRAWSSDDFTEFSWLTPTHRVYVTYYMTKPVPSWASSAFSAMNIGHQTVLTAAKLVASTLLDLFLDSNLLGEAQQEFKERTRKNKWHSLIPEHKEPPRRSPLPEEHYKALREACRRMPDLEFLE